MGLIMTNEPSPCSGDRGDAGINKCHCSEGLSILGAFLSDGQSWCHIFQRQQTVSSASFVAVMDLFFQWLAGNGGIKDNSLLYMDGATAHSKCFTTSPVTAHGRGWGSTRWQVRLASTLP